MEKRSTQLNNPLALISALLCFEPVESLTTKLIKPWACIQGNMVCICFLTRQLCWFIYRTVSLVFLRTHQGIYYACTWLHFVLSNLHEAVLTINTTKLTLKKDECSQRCDSKLFLNVIGEALRKCRKSWLYIRGDGQSEVVYKLGFIVLGQATCVPFKTATN